MRFMWSIGALLFALGMFAFAQVPAPDFWIEPFVDTPQAFHLDLHVTGPPSSGVAVLFTFDDPFSTPPEQLIIYPLLSSVLDLNGHFVHSFGVPSWQGPLPDVWFGAIVFPPAGGVVVSGIVALGGCLAGPGPIAFMNTAAVIDFNYTSHTAKARVKISAPGTVVMWTVPATACPVIGAVGWPTAATAATFVSSKLTDASGSVSFDESVSVPSGADLCIVLTSGGQVIGVTHVHGP